MAASPIDLKAVTAAGFAALKRGDATAARAHFDQAVVAGAADAAIWFGLSVVHRSSGASAEESAALDQALTLDAHHLPALLAKGDVLVKLGDRRAADAYYTAALKLAPSLPSLPPEWRAELRRVEAVSQRFAREYETHLLAALSASGLGAPGTERFSHAVDLLLGKKQIYLQQPKYFYFPELAPVQFFDRRQFAWTQALEQAFEGIRAEARALLDAGTGFVPYVQRAANRPNFDPRGLLDNTDWTAFFSHQGWSDGGGQRGALSPDARRAARCAVMPDRQPHPLGAVLAAATGGADSAAPGVHERTADLPFAAHRAAKLRLAGGQ